ncbi:MAG TPA: glutamate synthase large subunit [Acidimicrobiales bacterium]|nr:glutamate synthase large subunit [Acidimicrobiales bacterium]
MAVRHIRGGLYDARTERDACGVAFVADMVRGPSHEIVDLALTALENLAHRGAFGADPDTGDGAGILIQMPDELFRAVAGVALPPRGHYASGMAFLPASAEESARAESEIESIAATEGLAVLGWRDVPVDLGVAGASARSVAPRFRQLFLAADPAGHVAGASGDLLERLVYVVRKRVEHAVDGCYFPSLSTRTFVYKGMLSTEQLRRFFADLSDARCASPLALVHSRFSTNTFPSWPLAHPYRLVAHNGEINTVGGNRNWMRAREALLSSDLIPGDIGRLLPILTEGASDSASFDEVLELLHLGGRSLPHSVLMMIPEAWEGHREMDAPRRAFYQYHGCLMEPWDGPAAVAFTDGSVIGAVLDRNGLRPARYWVTGDGLVVLASEVGVLDIDPARVVRKGRLQPGKMFLVDTVAGRIVDDAEVKATLAAEHPYQDWLDKGLVRLSEMPRRDMLLPQHGSVVRHQRLFGFTGEELRVIVGPMATTAGEPIGSMGSDTPLAVLSDRPRLLFDYFSQLFAQVTNPPLDAIREELVTSLSATIGPERNLLEPGPDSCRQIVLEFPVIDNDDLAKLLYVDEHGETPGFSSFAIDGLYPVAGGGAALREAIEHVCDEVLAAIDRGVNIVVLSDRHSSQELAPIPSLLLTAAVHHHLVRERARTRTGLVVETGEAREVHHMALLVGYGAAAVNPYLAIESIAEMADRGELGDLPARRAVRNYVKAAGKGVLKVMSKMGISTIASYTGAQVFEAVGLDNALVEQYFTGTASRIGGSDLDALASEVAQRHHLAWEEREGELAHREIAVGGDYQWRREGEHHLFNPRTVFTLQHATRARRYEVFKKYTTLVDDQSSKLATLRGLLRLRTGEAAPRPAVAIEEVEPVETILRRFATGAMSYGSISAEAHETLAVAMNRLGGKSNTGEGGEDPERFRPDPNGDSRRSAIKQVASGRFGVTSEYLVNADDIQIKMAQGAKPGEGGQLPGNKVYPWIARTRYSTPGVGLISPPPHHDIYSIEDLAQLIHDLKNANPRARINVKLVAEHGVGTVAAGVAKAHADVVLISGDDGGTGAAPLTSLKHAGAPWELGLAEAQQTLVRNGLRDRIVVQVDGQMKTGRDVVVAALLGAEEFGFATAPLVVSGCVMMRVCHLDTCPVGIATQNPELRKRFTGRPEFVETFFRFIAEEVREHLAALGFRSIEEAVGHVECLDVAPAVEHYKASGLDLTPLLVAETSVHGDCALHQVIEQDHGLADALDQQLIARCAPALERGEAVVVELAVRNVHRTVGTMLGSEVTRRHGAAGLPDGTIRCRLTGSAGQSFGAFLPAGVELTLVGDANDYLGKGLSGGRIVVRPPDASPFPAEENIIAGNVLCYGATRGEVFVRGQVGERFCVRNSGATAVVEGVGDHACEYMTGGTVLILGETGRNVAAGMSGGVAYVHDPARRLERRANLAMVELEPLDDADRAVVTTLLERHRELTGSTLADRLLGRIDAALAECVKVMPTDYKRVLEATRDAEARGLPVDDAIMAAAHG